MKTLNAPRGLGKAHETSRNKTLIGKYPDRKKRPSLAGSFLPQNFLCETFEKNFEGNFFFFTLNLQRMRGILGNFAWMS